MNGLLTDFHSSCCLPSSATLVLLHRLQLVGPHSSSTKNSTNVTIDKSVTLIIPLSQVDDQLVYVLRNKICICTKNLAPLHQKQRLEYMLISQLEQYTHTKDQYSDLGFTSVVSVFHCHTCI